MENQAAEPLSVSQLSGHIQHTLEQGYSNIWVKGEISNLTKHSSGHWYFSLKDSQAQLGAVMFRGMNQRVRFDPAHGMEVTAHGRISVYPPQGRYQLIVDQLLPAGQGDLHLAFEELKKKLETEGLFAASLKKSLPSFPHKIGIVTSPTGAAIRDMLNILQRRYPLTQILLMPVKVQGEGAAAEIARAIAILNERADCDLLIVGRGGGSLEDLWAFNEEPVARAIAASRIPVISAVGHETDTTISDYVADRRAPTPSAAAELAVPDQLKLREYLLSTSQQLGRNLRRRVEKQEQMLRSIEKSYALRRPALLIEERLQRLDLLQDAVLRRVQERYQTAEQQLKNMEQHLAALNPLSILERGYSAVSGADGKLIRSISQVSINDLLDIRLKDGSVLAGVNQVKPKK